MSLRATAYLLFVFAATAPAVSTAQWPAEPRNFETLALGDGNAVGINANNQVAIVRGYRSFVWSESTGAIDLGGFDPDVPQTRAYDIDDRGAIAGRVLSRYGFYHPFIWTAATGLVDADPDIYAESAAWAINAGVIVGGNGPVPGVFETAFRREPTGKVTRLNPLGGSCGSAAYDVNMFALAVGESSFPGGCDEPYRYHPFVWSETGARDLGTLGGADGRAVRINSINQVVGDSTTASGDRHAFLWSDRSGMKDLGTLGGAWSIARAVNEFGHVVGSSVDGQGNQRAFLWTPLAGMLDLGPGEAVAINEFDHVVGSSTEGGVLKAFLWTASDGRMVLADDARAVGVNNNANVVGDVNVSAGAQVTIWRMAITEADRLVYRFGLVDSHVAYGTLRHGHAQALRAQLRAAQRAMENGRRDRAEGALERFARRLAAWALDELPWQ